MKRVAANFRMCKGRSYLIVSDNKKKVNSFHVALSFNKGKTLKRYPNNCYNDFGIPRLFETPAANKIICRELIEL
jgi:hypothetical protein